MTPDYQPSSEALRKEGMTLFGWKWVEAITVISATAQKYVQVSDPKFECMIRDIAFQLLSDADRKK